MILCPVWTWNLTVDLAKQKGTPSLLFQALCVICSQLLIQTRVAVRNAQFGSKSAKCLSSATLKFDRWPWKTIRQPFSSISSYVYYFVAICKFKLDYDPETLKLGKMCFDLCDRDLWPLTLTVCMHITSVNCNNSCKFQDDTTGKLSKRCDGRMDGRTERSLLRAAWSPLKHWKKCICDMAFIVPMHRNKPNITYLLTLIYAFIPRRINLFSSRKESLEAITVFTNSKIVAHYFFNPNCMAFDGPWYFYLLHFNWIRCVFGSLGK